MLSTILNAMLPIIVTLLLGVVAAWHQDFNAKDAAIFNRMVMLYALPLVLFSGIVSTPRSQLVGHGALTAVLIITLFVTYLIPLLIARYLIGRDLMTSALQALVIGCPNAGFIGLPVLGYLFGPSVATISVAVTSLVLVLFNIPLTMVILAAGAGPHGDASGGRPSALHNILATLKEPLVWLPLLGFIMVLIDIRFPPLVGKSLGLLGNSTGGVALFASGIIIFSQRLTLNVPVGVSTLSRNLLIPAAVWGLVTLFPILPPEQTKEAIITLAIPSVVVGVILSVQYRVAEQEIASTIFWSTILSLPTMGMFIWLLGA